VRRYHSKLWVLGSIMDLVERFITELDCNVGILNADQPCPPMPPKETSGV
jgi:hypothetical protein